MVKLPGKGVMMADWVEDELPNKPDAITTLFELKTLTPSVLKSNTPFESHMEAHPSSVLIGPEIVTGAPELKSIPQNAPKYQMFVCPCE